jgi:hypothetical protein
MKEKGEMENRSRVLLGAAMVVVGLLSLACMGMGALLGLNPLGFVWRLWPLLVIGVGLLFLAPPILVRGKQGLGALFIPGLPILTTGGILLLASVLDAWSVWAWLWPMELISLATGFVLAAVYMRLVWFLIPATIIGLNGVVFQFCAITGLWNWWSVLWLAEPLAVGIALLLTGALAHTRGLVTAGLILCSIAGAGLLLAITIVDAWWPVRLLGPALLILAGLAMVAWTLLRPRIAQGAAAE